MYRYCPVLSCRIKYDKTVVLQFSIHLQFQNHSYIGFSTETKLFKAMRHVSSTLNIGIKIKKDGISTIPKNISITNQAGNVENIVPKPNSYSKYCTEMSQMYGFIYLLSCITYGFDSSSPVNYPQVKTSNNCHTVLHLVIACITDIDSPKDRKAGCDRVQ